MNEARSIALVGLRCVGKSTVGRLLAERLGRRFVDVDVALARRFAPGRSAGEFLADEGLEVFRRREAEVLAELLYSSRESVLATGGGCVETASSRELLVERSDTIWLRADPALLGKRLQASSTYRPALTGHHDPALELAELSQRRSPWYAEVARWTLDVDELKPSQVADWIVERIAESEPG